MRFPRPLKPGGTIGIVSPASWAKPAWITRGKKALEKRGYKVIVHPQNYLKMGTLAGSDAARADALMDMFADSAIDAILCARGGAGVIRIIDKLDYKRIKRHPKPFAGFSDITLLLRAIEKNCGFVTWHGPMLWNFAHPHDPRTIDDLLAAMSGRKKAGKRRFSGTKCGRAGRAKGTLVGGNLSLLQSMIGTPYDWSGRNAILFVEEVEEPLYKIDRAVRHLRLAGKFNGVRGVLVGEMVGVSSGKPGSMRRGEKPYGRSLQQIFMDSLPSGIPVGFSFPCGHGKYLTTLPVGAQAELTVTARGTDVAISEGILFP